MTPHEALLEVLYALLDDTALDRMTLTRLEDVAQELLDEDI